MDKRKEIESELWALIEQLCFRLGHHDLVEQILTLRSELYALPDQDQPKG